jgi:hypothetical protein
MKPNTSLVHGVEQLAHILEREPTKTLIKVAYDKDQIEEALMKSCVKDRVIFWLIRKLNLKIYILAQ